MSNNSLKPNLNEIVKHVFTLVDTDEPKTVISKKSLNLTDAILSELGGVNSLLENYYIVGIKLTLAGFNKATAIELDNAIAFFFKNKSLLLESMDSYTIDVYKGDIKKMMERMMPELKLNKRDAQAAMTCLIGNDNEHDDLDNLTEQRKMLILGLVFFVYGYISFNVNSKVLQKEIEQKPVELFGVTYTREEFEVIKLDFAS